MRLQSLIAALIDAVLRRPRVSAALAACAVAAACAGLPLVRVDFRFQSFIGSDDPAFLDLQRYVEAFGADDAALVVTACVEDGSLLSPERLRAFERTLADLRSLPITRSIVGLLDAPAPLSPGFIDGRSLLDSMPKDAKELAVWQAHVLADPLLVPALVSSDGRTAMAVVQLAIEASDILEARPAVQAVRRVLDLHTQQDGIRYLAAGIPAVRSDLVDAILHDQLRFTLLTVVVMGALLLALFRSVQGLVISLGLAVVPALMLTGILGLAGEPIGLLTQVLPTLIPVIGVADAIHVLTRFYQEAALTADKDGRINAEQARSAVQRTYAAVGVACFFTSLTTAIGFGSLTLADMTVLRTFGLYAALGVALAYGATLAIGPLLLARIRTVPRSPTAHEADAMLARIADFAERRRLPIVAVCGAIGVASAVLGARVPFDDRLRDGLADGSPAVLANDVVDRELGGVITLALDLTGPVGAFNTPAVLAASLDVERWARGTPPFRTAMGPGTWAGRENATITGVNEVATEPELLAQLALLTEPSGPARSRLVTPDGGRARILVSLPDVSKSALLDAAERLNREAMRRFTPVGVRATVTGSPYAAQRGLSRLSSELLGSLLAAFVVIAALLALLFRDVRVALLALPPNVLPLVLCLGLMALLGWSLNPTSGVVFCIALGIAVDDTLHLVMRIREENAHGHFGAPARKRALLGTGRALILTSLILGLGFAVNALSSFPVNRTLGVLGASAIASALLFDMLLLPALLSLAERSPRTL